MTYRERQNGEGWFTADVNNERNSARGAFVRSGGAVTVGASSTEIECNVDAVEVRIGGVDYSQSSGTVTLPDNSTAYPRRDLVTAQKGPTASDPASFEVVAGDPIGDDTFETLASEGVIEGRDSDSPGAPIHPAENIPEVQPPDATGLRDKATVLAMAYVPPDTADSTDMAGSYLTDLRREGIGLSDVLRSGDAIDEVESHGETISATAKNAERFGGRTKPGELYQRTGLVLAEELASGANQISKRQLHVPDGQTAYLWAAGVYDGDGLSNSFVGRFLVDGAQEYTIETAYEDGGDGGGGVSEPWLRSVGQDAQISFRLVNDSASSATVITRWVITFES